MFGAGLSLSFALLAGYVLWRVGGLPWVAARLRRRWLVGGGALLFCLFASARYLAHGPRSTVGRVVELVGMDALVVLFLLAMALLAVDVGTGFGHWWTAHLSRLRVGALAVGVGLSAVSVYQGMRAPVVTELEVGLPRLPKALDGTVLVALADLHVGGLVDARWLEARVAQTNELRPDLIVLVGDIVEGHSGRDEGVRDALAKLSAPLGVFAVAGNHERPTRPGSSLALIASAGVTLLRDRSVELKPGLVLAGVDDLTTQRRAGGSVEEALQRALLGRPDGATILLSHSPLGLEAAARLGVDLMLCGHTHGGQVWPFDLVTGLVHPVVEGRAEIGTMVVVVSRGAGTWGPRMRLWSPGEVLRITLRAR